LKAVDEGDSCQTMSLYVKPNPESIKNYDKTRDLKKVKELEKQYQNKFYKTENEIRKNDHKWK